MFAEIGLEEFVPLLLIAEDVIEFADEQIGIDD
jgi:hypothetical protein